MNTLHTLQCLFLSTSHRVVKQSLKYKVSYNASNNALVHTNIQIEIPNTEIFLHSITATKDRLGKYVIFKQIHINMKESYECTALKIRSTFKQRDHRAQKNRHNFTWYCKSKTLRIESLNKRKRKVKSSVYDWAYKTHNYTKIKLTLRLV